MTEQGIDRRSFAAGCLGIAFASPLVAQGLPSVSSTPTGLLLSNGVVERQLVLPGNGSNALRTASYRPHGKSIVYLEDWGSDRYVGAAEFGFRAGGIRYGAETAWRLVATEAAADGNGGRGASIRLVSGDGKVEVTSTYLLYPGTAAMLKSIEIRNMSRELIPVEDVDVEIFPVTGDASTYGWIYSDYGRRKSIGPFVGGRQDALVALHDPDSGQGLVLGNEAAGVMKYTGFCDEQPVLRAGLARSGGAFPFRRWLEPGQAYRAPSVFSIVYGDTPRFETVLNTAVPDFVRKHMGTRLSSYPSKPTFVYNTWEPFKKDINEDLIKALALKAAAAGAETFVIDDGWQDTYGDWNVNLRKFPGGLKPITDYIKRLGMKPGLWVSIGSAARDSRVYKEHPEWFARNAQGQQYSVHRDQDPDQRMTACMSTGWRDYIQELLSRLTVEHGFEYMKLDFAVVTSPYQFDPTKTGCFARDHPGHRDHAESLSVNFDYLWQVFDNFKAKHPDVFIDCTFETMGGLQLIDYAMLRHAEGNWLSNFNEPDEENDLRVRQMAWWRSPAMPATSLVLGNPKLADAGFELHLKSLAGALPIVLGDTRKMSLEDVKLSKRYSDFFARIQARHDVFSFRQDLPGFGEPTNGQWDGFQRLNTDTGSGGLIGVFRHGSADGMRRVRPWLLNPGRSYSVRSMDGVEIVRATGRHLMANGFDVALPKLYDGSLMEIARVS